jgi:hypothetical protein
MDRQRVLNIMAIATSVAVFILFQVGQISEANAFFGVVAIATIYTGRQLAQRDGEPVGAALVSMFAKPSSYPRRTAYVAYVASMGIGAFVMTQALVA